MSQILLFLSVVFSLFLELKITTYGRKISICDWTLNTECGTKKNWKWNMSGWRFNHFHWIEKNADTVEWIWWEHLFCVVSVSPRCVREVCLWFNDEFYELTNRVNDRRTWLDYFEWRKNVLHCSLRILCLKIRSRYDVHSLIRSFAFIIFHWWRRCWPILWRHYDWFRKIN